MSADLAALLAPIAAALLPGWTVTCAWRAPDAMPMPGALATCSPTPTRSIAHVDVVDPWPAGEDLAETLWHELTHALLSPLTALIPASDGAVMVEEQAVERLGGLLSKLAPAARAAVLRGVDMYGGAPLRARISALAPRARGGQMDPKIITEALDALIAGDAEKCTELLKGLIAAAAGAPVAPTAAPPNSDPAPPAGEMPAGGAPVQEAKPGEPPAAGGARVAARKGAAVADIETMRARKEAQGLRDELRQIAGDARADGKEKIVASLRARFPGHDGLAAVEKRIHAAGDYGAAKMIADIAIEMGSVGPQRARSGVEHGIAEPTVGEAKAVPAAELAKEGFDSGFAASYARLHARDPQAAAAELEGGREALASKRARMAKTGGAP